MAIALSGTQRQRFRIYGLPAAACLCMLLSYAPYADARTRSAPAPLRIYTAIAPLAFCVEHIGSGLVTVEALMPEGQDPHLFDPDPGLLRRLSNADIYFATGLPFERLLVQKITARRKKLNIIDLTRNIRLLDIEEHGGHHHGGPDTGADPHFWLGTPQLRQFILAAARALAGADPEHASAYQEGAARMLACLNAVHTRNSALLAPFRGRAFFVYHPAFGYFARTYGLRQHAVETSGHQPGPRHIAELISDARSRGVRTIFVQPQFDAKSAQAIAQAIDGSVVPLDPLAPDVLKNLETMGRAIAGSFARDANLR